MTHTLQIACDHNGDVPRVWHNFIMHVHEKTAHMTYTQYKAVLNATLSEYNGQSDLKQIVFTDADSLTQFMLTFS